MAKIGTFFRRMLRPALMTAVAASLIAGVQSYSGGEGFAQAATLDPTYYVAPNGMDTNPGSLSQPFKTIQRAADLATAGTTVYVRAGTYPGNVNLKRSGVSGSPIVFTAYPGEQPVLDCAGTRRNGFTDRYETSARSDFVIDGFEIKACTIGIELERSSSFSVRNNRVSGSRQHGISATNGTAGVITGNTVFDTGINSGGYTGIFLEGTSGYEISDNTVYNSRQNGIMLSYQANDNLVQGNEVYNNSCYDDQRYAGIAIEVDSHRNRVANNLLRDNCHAGYLTNSPDNLIDNNTFYGNQEAQISLGDWLGSTPINNTFRNNIVVVTRSTDKAVAHWKDSTPHDARNNHYDYNLYYYAAGGDRSDLFTLSGYGNYSFSSWRQAGLDPQGKLANPQFVNSSAKDFHLQSSSPALDVGSDVGLRVDRDGVTRPQGSGFDRGAYERPSTIPSTPVATATTTATKTPAATSTPTNTPSPTATKPPTSTPVPPTSTPMPTSTATSPPSTSTPTAVPPTATSVPPIATPVPLTATPVPPTPTVAPTSNPTNPNGKDRPTRPGRSKRDR